MTSVFVIAEAGVNHNGSLDVALRLVNAAKAAGADAIKFQTFSAARLATRFAPKAKYQEIGASSDETQLDMLQRLELSHQDHFKIKAHCQKSGITFMSSPFDIESLRFLVDEVGVDRIKIPSGEVTNGPFLITAAETNLPLIISSGMADLGEIEMALGAIAYARSGEPKVAPGADAFRRAWAAAAASGALRSDITVLHCTTDYPASLEDLNLNVIPALAKHLDLNVGYSDHSQGIVASPAAVALGAVVVEKHFTLDRAMPGPDHAASLTPSELKEMIFLVRQTARTLGKSEKQPGESERLNLNVARKSLTAALPIRKGDSFSENNISVQRPGHGISPMKYWDFIGKAATRDYEIGETITEELDA